MIPNNVLITDDAAGELAGVCQSKGYTKIAVLVDENTEKYCLPQLSEHIPEHWSIRIASGETNKTLQTCEQIWTALTEAGFDRKSLLINLGGGVIGDMGGFCAATFKRGIDFVNVPTTLLAQVDASVGGKLGIDFHGYKNHIGTFTDPEKVIISARWLDTLGKKELRSGFAEIIKHSLIADLKYWQQLIVIPFEDQDWQSHIEHSVRIKSSIVKEDPYESGLRKLLNFGHTIGHAIETVFLPSDEHRLLHGEAVAIGMICEAFISTKKAGLEKEELEEISNYLLKVFGKIDIDKSQFEAIVSTCAQDKKNQGNVINCTLLQSIGSGIVDVPISDGEVLDALFYYYQLDE